MPNKNRERKAFLRMPELWKLQFDTSMVADSCHSKIGHIFCFFTKTKRKRFNFEIKIKVKVKKKKIIVKVKEMCPWPKTAVEILKITIFVFPMAKSCHSIPSCLAFFFFNLNEKSFYAYVFGRKNKKHTLETTFWTEWVIFGYTVTREWRD